MICEILAKTNFCKTIFFGSVDVFQLIFDNENTFQTILGASLVIQSTRKLGKRGKTILSPKKCENPFSHIFGSVEDFQ